MFAKVGRHVRQQYAGFLALFIALGGVSYAAATLPANSVGSRQIRPGAVKNSDLGRSSVTSGKVKDGSLLSLDFKPGQLAAGAPGATGPQGLKGDKGDKGDPGTNGTDGAAGSARAYGEVRINGSGNYELVPGTTKNVVALGQGGGGNPAACIQLAPSIDASSAITVATSNNRSGSGQAFDSQVQVARPLAYCGGVLSNVVEVVTTSTTSPGAATKRAFVFAVM